MSGGIFKRRNCGEKASYLRLMDRGQGCCKTSYNAEDTSYGNYPAKDVNSTKVEQSWIKVSKPKDCIWAVCLCGQGLCDRLYPCVSSCFTQIRMHVQSLIYITRPQELPRILPETLLEYKLVPGRLS